jgi:hypothetical protein
MTGGMATLPPVCPPTSAALDGTWLSAGEPGPRAKLAGC